MSAGAKDFHLLGRFQTGVFSLIGHEIKGHNEALTGSSTALSQQGTGAMLALVVMMLWTCRAHLRRVVRSAWYSSHADDGRGEEILIYRWLWLGCTAFVFGRLVATGLPPLSTTVFLSRREPGSSGMCAHPDRADADG